MDEEEDEEGTKVNGEKIIDDDDLSSFQSRILVVLALLDQQEAFAQF